MLDFEKEIVISWNRREPYFSMKETHMHTSYEFYYLISGDRRFFIDASIYKMQKGDLIIVPKMAIHKTGYVSDKPFERYDLYVPENDMEEIASELDREKVMQCLSKIKYSLQPSGQTYVEGILKKCRNECKTNDIYTKQLLKGYVKELLVYLIRYGEEFELGKMERVASGISEKAARYILDNYGENISLDFISEYVGVSGPYFSKKFKADTGFGFKEFLLNVRMKNACKMLVETKKQISAIAFKCGFEDANYFGDVFKKIKGISPMKYRKKMQEALE